MNSRLNTDDIIDLDVGARSGLDPAPAERLQGAVRHRVARVDTLKIIHADDTQMNM